MLLLHHQALFLRNAEHSFKSFEFILNISASRVFLSNVFAKSGYHLHGLLELLSYVMLVENLVSILLGDPDSPSDDGLGKQVIDEYPHVLLHYAVFLVTYANDIDLPLELLLELPVFLTQPIVLLLDLQVMLDLLTGVLVPNQLLIFELQLMQLSFKLGLLIREELDSPQHLLHLKFSLSKLVLDVFVVLAYLLEGLSIFLLDPKHVLDLLVLQLHKLFQTFGLPL